MGLDMFIFGRVDDHMEDEELAYWRKHPNLHGFIVQTFAEGVDKCQRIPLGEKDLKTIIEAVRRKKLPATSGFFFGESETPNKGDTIAQLENVIRWMRTNKRMMVTYQASW